MHMSAILATAWLLVSKDAGFEVFPVPAVLPCPYRLQLRGYMLCK